MGHPSNVTLVDAMSNPPGDRVIDSITGRVVGSKLTVLRCYFTVCVNPADALPLSLLSPE